MWDMVRAGGWLMLPIICCSVLALAIVLERLWALQAERVAPAGLAAGLLRHYREGKVTPATLDALRRNSVLGRILAAGLGVRSREWNVVKERIEDAGRHAVHQLERYLNTLGTIATVSPLLGLLGTVVGMIRVFAAMNRIGTADPSALAGGIAQALITTAAGLAVAIPSLILYRYLKGRVAELVIYMEQETLKLMEAVTGSMPREARERSAEQA